MDSECPLPIPMHRPYLIDDARYDTPLPFRRDLKQVTEFTAENSLPYSLPKPLQPSMLERLPYEIREQIYGRLGIEYILRSRFDEDCRLDLLVDLEKTEYTESLWHRGFPLLEKSILVLNHNIRAEVLDILSRRFANDSIHFNYHLSDKKIYFNNWAALGRGHRFALEVNATSNAIILGLTVRRGNWQRMRTASSSFQFLRRIRLKDHYFDKYANEKPHPGRVSRRQFRRPIVKRAESIRFLAKHCPLLLSFHIAVEDIYYYDKHVPAKFYEPVVFALREMTRGCQKLETLGIAIVVNQRGLNKDGTLDRLKDENVCEDIELNLRAVPAYLRDDVTEVWSRTAFREHVDYGRTIRFLSPEEWEKREPPYRGTGPKLAPV